MLFYPTSPYPTRSCTTPPCPTPHCTSAHTTTRSVQILQTRGVQFLLAEVHAALERARPPRHLRRALAPLRALLELLGDRACVPATLRYVLALLLRLLHTQCASPYMCGMCRKDRRSVKVYAS